MVDPVKILLVDDEARNLDALEAILDEPGYQLVRAQDADRALFQLLQHDFAAIVLDIKMPGISGFELATLIKGRKKSREIPILFLTAYMLDDEHVLTGYGAGAVDYLTKPVQPQVLRHKIGVFADLFRKTRALAQLNDTLEERVRERTEALRLAGEQKDRFLATLAHELRNPLAPLRTGLDYLGMRADLPVSASQKTLDVMNRQLDHMVRLIDDLLDVSRISRGQLELLRAPAELVAVVQQAIDGARPYLDKRGQSVELVASAAIHAIVDATRVAQIVGNLLHNASKFSPRGGVMRVEVAAEGEVAIVRVIDHGAGIRAEDLAHVFEMFARPRDAGAPADGGLGIGLALARRLAELHGGELVGQSDGEGTGATFTLSLGGVIAPPPAATAGADGANPGPAVDRLAIVVVEDNDDVADTLGEWLTDMGHAVTIARTGHDAVARVRAARPDVVLCDLGLPDIDGVEVCRRVRAMTDVPRPLMVALTGWGMDSDRQRTHDAGFDHHLVKPIDGAALQELLAKASPRSSR